MNGIHSKNQSKNHRIGTYEIKNKFLCLNLIIKFVFMIMELNVSVLGHLS